MGIIQMDPFGSKIDVFFWDQDKETTYWPARSAAAMLARQREEVTPCAEGLWCACVPDLVG